MIFSASLMPPFCQAYLSRMAVGYIFFGFWISGFKQKISFWMPNIVLTVRVFSMRTGAAIFQLVEV